MNKHNSSHTPQKGFTIVELMIATVVLSTLLLLATAVMINMGKLLNKGINQAKIQDGTRNIVDQTTKDIQFSPSDPLPSNYPISLTGQGYPTGASDIKAYCIGNVRYSYVTGIQVGTDPPQIPHVFWRDILTRGATCKPLDLRSPDAPTSYGGAEIGIYGQELIPSNSQLTSFDIQPSQDSYVVSVSTAYGAFDLMSGSGKDTTCNGTTGGEFCATDYLHSHILRRLAGGN